MSNAVITGFEELDKYLSRDEIIEFFSEQREILDAMYHRVLALLSPLNLIIVGVRGGFDPLAFKKFCRIFNKDAELYIQRTFKAEDIEPSLLDRKMDLPLVIYNPYGYRKLYAKVIAGIKASRNRVVIFSLMDRKRKGSTLGAHIAHSMIELKGDEKGIQARIVKSVIVGDTTIKFSKSEFYYNSSRNSLLEWIKGG